MHSQTEQLPPLANKLVVGLEHSVAGPLCTRILGDLGAKVIKLERLPDGDFSRHWDANAGGEGAQYWWLNRGKQSILIDLNSDDGRLVFERLLDRADVLVQNMSPMAASRQGLDGPAFDERYPSLVHCHISGYGGDSTLRDRKAYDMLVQAEAGIMSVTGTPEQPMRTGVSLCDVGTGIYAATLVLGALLEQQVSGRGKRIELAMFDVATEFLAPMLVSYANAAVSYTRSPDRHPAIAPYGTFRCKDGGSVVIAVEQQHEWRLVCEHLLHDVALADEERFSSNAARIANRTEVDALLAQALGRLTVQEVVHVLRQMDLPYAMVNDVQAVTTHPVTSERGILAEVPAEDANSIVTLVGVAERLFGSRTEGRLRPPRLGEDTDSILADLGLDPMGVANR